MRRSLRRSSSPLSESFENISPKRDLILGAHRPDTLTVVTVVVVCVDVDREEVEAASIVGVARVERTLPVVAVGAHAAHASIAEAVARRRQEDVVAVGSGDLVAAAGP